MKKTVSLLLSAMMMLSSFQFTVLAEDENSSDQPEETVTETENIDTENGEESSENSLSEITETETVSEAETEEEPDQKEPQGLAEESKAAEASEQKPVETEETLPEKDAVTETAPEVTETEEKQNAASSKCGDNLTWKFSSGTLTVSGTGYMYDFSESDTPPWSDYRTNIKTIKVENGVTSIGNYAFFEYPNIEKVVLADSIKQIGEHALSYVFTNETKQYPVFTLPKQLEYVGDSAFEGDYCLPFSTATMPSGLRYIGNDAFWNCDGLLGELVLPEGLKKIGKCAFAECYYINSIRLPKTLEVIGAESFSFLDETTQVAVPNYVKRIEEYTFYSCDLRDVVIGKNVQYIGKAAFMENDNLQTITFLGDVPDFDTWAFGKSYDVTVKYPAGNQTWTAEAKAQVEKQFNSVQWEEIPCTGVDSVTIDQFYDDLIGGKEYQFSAYVTPSDAYDTGIVWETSNDTIATVTADGKVKGIKAGLSKITAISAFDRTKKAEKMVFVLFSDVTDSSKYYYDAVYWALEKGITTGTKPILFEPGATCTRGHIVTFLWRLAGSPDYSSAENPFVDVKEGAWYENAVKWAADNGITTGTTPTTFEPTAPCTRAHIVTFLYRYMHEPKDYPVKTYEFTDIKPDSWYEEAVKWAFSMDVTTGKTPTMFDPTGPCTRGQGVLFLMRVYNLMPA